MAKKMNDDTYDVLLNTRRDSTTLLAFWYVHKSFWALLLTGILIFAFFGDINDAALDFSSLRDLFSKTLSPVAGIIIAILSKILVDNIFVFTAYPLLEKRREYVTNRPVYTIFRFFDTWRDMRGISTLRWTHAVRQQAMQQFESDFFRSDKINNAIDLVTLLSLVLCILLLVFN